MGSPSPLLSIHCTRAQTGLAFLCNVWKKKKRWYVFSFGLWCLHRAQCYLIGTPPPHNLIILCCALVLRLWQNVVKIEVRKKVNHNPTNKRYSRCWYVTDQPPRRFQKPHTTNGKPVPMPIETPRAPGSAKAPLEPGLSESCAVPRSLWDSPQTWLHLESYL